MFNLKVALTTVIVLGLSLLFLGGSFSQATDFEWSGLYRIEGYHLNNTELGGPKHNLDYGLHHLSLKPKMVAGDGLTIYGQFELLTNSAYPNSQLGQSLGTGVGDGSPTDSDDSSSFSSHEKSDQFLISQLYLSWVHEYGALLVGRAPLQFGLGMSYSAGKGLFDHWFDTRDLVGYKIVWGNLFILPMYGKVAENKIHENDDVIDYMIQVQYENPETDLAMGGFYRVRKAQKNDSSDMPKGSNSIGGASAVDSSLKSNQINLYVLKDTPSFRFGIEASFMGGEIGVRTSDTGDKVTMNGFGLATELEWRPSDSKWQLGVKAGRATGDDPESDSRFEGFAFNRNYEVAMLLFNHSVGRNDVLRTKVWGGGPTQVSSGAMEQTHPDVESLSNALYFAPYARYKWTDKLVLTGVLATGQITVDPLLVGSVGKNLGFETDVSLAYSPRKGITWVNEIGLLFPGSAFRYQDAEATFAYGITSKLAIGF